MENSGKSGDEDPKGKGNNLSSVDNIVGNMALAHEIVMDTNFKLNEASPDSIEGQVKRIVHRAFWDSLEEEIARDPPNYTHAIKLLAELKEALLSLIPAALKEQINNVLDIDLITQQSEQGIVDISGYAKYVIGVMSKICTPARDNDIEKLKNVEGLTALLREIFHVLDLMKLDMANFHISMIRPQLVRQSVAYEQNKFGEYLKDNPDGLLSTKQWIKRGVDMVRNQNWEGDTEDGSRHSSSASSELPPELTEVIKHSYIGILLSKGEFPYPETLLMDNHRLAEMRRSVQCLLRVGSILVVTMNIVGKHLASDAEYKRTLKESIFILLKGIQESNLSSAFPNVCEQVIKETESVLSKRGLGTLDEENLSLLRQQIMNLAQDDHSVRQLIRKRVYSFMMNSLLRSNSSTSLQVPTALLDVETELVELTKQFSNLVSHNYMVYQPFYEPAFKDLL